MFMMCAFSFNLFLTFISRFLFTSWNHNSFFSTPFKCVYISAFDDETTIKQLKEKKKLWDMMTTCCMKRIKHIKITIRREFIQKLAVLQKWDDSLKRLLFTMSKRTSFFLLAAAFLNPFHVRSDFHCPELVVYIKICFIQRWRIL